MQRRLQPHRMHVGPCLCSWTLRVAMQKSTTYKKVQLRLRVCEPACSVHTVRGVAAPAESSKSLAGAAAAPSVAPLRCIVDVAEYASLNNIDAEFLPAGAADNSAAAAPPAAKSLLVLSGGRPLLLILLAEHRVDERRLALLTRCARRALRLATPAEVLALSGFPVGAVPPFGHGAALPTLLDVGVRSSPNMLVNPAGGVGAECGPAQHYAARPLCSRAAHFLKTLCALSPGCLPPV